MEIIKNIENQEASDSNYISYEDFDGLEEIRLIPYLGKENTPYTPLHGREMIEYFSELDIDIPEEWLDGDGDIRVENLSSFLTMHIVVGKIVVAEEIRSMLDEDEEEIFDKVIEDINSQLEEERVNRIDRLGYKRRLHDGFLVEDHFKEMGFPVNQEKRVSRDELHAIVRYVLSELKKDVW